MSQTQPPRQVIARIVPTKSSQGSTIQEEVALRRRKPSVTMDACEEKAKERRRTSRSTAAQRAQRAIGRYSSVPRDTCEQVVISFDRLDVQERRRLDRMATMRSPERQEAWSSLVERVDFHGNDVRLRDRSGSPTHERPIESQDVPVLPAPPRLPTHVNDLADARDQAPAVRRVLIVDHDADSRRMLQELLAPSFDVLAVEDGLEAADWFGRGYKPDLIIVEVALPRIDGFCLVGAMRGRADLRDVPVMFTSSRESRNDAARALCLGVLHILPKPLKPSVVLGEVGKLLGE